MTLVFFGVAFGRLYPVFMTWQVKQGKTIPTNSLGSLPGNAFQATGSLRLLQWSLPSLVIAGILIVADFCIQWRMLVFILSLFNNAVQTGPSWGSRRISATKIGLFKQPRIQRLLAHNILQIWMTLGEARSQNSLVLGYIGAATLFGRDGSPFITSAADLKMVLHNVRMGGVPEFKVEFMPDDSALVYMDAKVPLECESTHPVKIEQSTIDSNDVIEKPMKTTALVLNCTFRSMRPSGIYMSLQGQFRLLKLHLY